MKKQPLRAFIALLILICAAKATSQDLVSDRVGISRARINVNDTGGIEIGLDGITALTGLDDGFAIVYSDRMGNGPAGKSFSISPVSAIARCSFGREHENHNLALPTAVGVSLSKFDGFCLDDQMLLRVSGEYGSDGAEYRLENDPFLRVFSTGGDNSDSAGGYTGPMAFEVHGRDGSTRFYGQTVDSRSNIPQCSSPCVNIKWFLNKDVSNVGGYRNYLYSKNPTIISLQPDDTREALHNPAARAVLSYRAPSIGDRRWPSSLEAVRRSLS